MNKSTSTTATLLRIAFLVFVCLFSTGFRCGSLAEDCLVKDDCLKGMQCVDFQCVSQSNLCPNGNECCAGQPCLQGRTCQGGLCVVQPSTKCQKDSDCKAKGEDWFCSGGLCKQKSVCPTHFKCPTHQLCFKGVCHDKNKLKCSNDNECPARYACKDQRCQTCPDDYKCGSEEMCVNGSCIPAEKANCNRENKCPPGYTCGKGSCQKDKRCPIDLQCTQEQKCIDGQCVDVAKIKCKNNENCPSRYKCEKEACKLKQCPKDFQCTGEYRCFKGACEHVTRIRCEKQEDCGKGYNCVKGDCKKPPPCPSNPVRSCYTGPVSAKGIGICKEGSQKCQNGVWGPCTGDIKPGHSDCNGKDNDCDGKIDLCGKGDWCDASENKKCEAKFDCHQSKCAQPCDPAKGEAGNPSCSHNEMCYKQSATKGVCKEICYPRKGAKCASGYYCFEYQQDKGICIPLAPPRFGPRKLGEKCSTVDKNRYCDGTNDLACIGQTCEKACTPGASSCTSGQTCANTPLSFLGGYCK